jgi:uncharacterized cupredoxin-like copper-binding protein
MTIRQLTRRFVPAPAFAIGFMVVGFVACSSGKGASQVAVSMTDGQLRADPGAVSHGKADFNVNNSSNKAHSFVVVKTDTPPEQLAVDKDGHVNTDGKVGKVDSFNGPNVTKKLSVDLKPGHYVLVSDTPGDYQQGMRAVLTVQ